MAPVQVIRVVLRLVIGGVFLYAGALKIWDPQQFALDVQHYELTPWTISVLVAIYLPWLEVCAGLALVAQRLVFGALLALGGMMIVFLGALVSAWTRGLDISCGCFGKESRSILTNFPLLLGQDIALLALILVLFVVEARRAPRISDSPRPSDGD